MRTILRILAVSFITGFSGAVTPGPMLALVIGQTSAQGFSAVLWICTGHALLELVVLLLLIAGLHAPMRRSVVRAAFSLLGGVLLLVLGADMLGSAVTALGGNVLADAAARCLTGPMLLLAGAGVCLANPYFLGWWGTVGSGQMAALQPRTSGEYVAFYAGHELSDLVWYGLVGYVVASGQRWFSPTVYHALVLVSGAAVLGLAVFFIAVGIRSIRSGRW